MMRSTSSPYGSTATDTPSSPSVNVAGAQNTQLPDPTHLSPVSYTHLTLPTIYSV